MTPRVRAARPDPSFLRASHSRALHNAAATVEGRSDLKSSRLIAVLRTASGATRDKGKAQIPTLRAQSSRALRMGHPQNAMRAHRAGGASHAPTGGKKKGTQAESLCHVLRPERGELRSPKWTGARNAHNNAVQNGLLHGENIWLRGGRLLDGSGALRYRPGIKFRTPRLTAGEVRWTQNQ